MALSALAPDSASGPCKGRMGRAQGADKRRMLGTPLRLVGGSALQKLGRASLGSTSRAGAAANSAQPFDHCHCGLLLWAVRVAAASSRRILERARAAVLYMKANGNWELHHWNICLHNRIHSTCPYSPLVGFSPVPLAFVDSKSGRPAFKLVHGALLSQYRNPSTGAVPCFVPTSSRHCLSHYSTTALLNTVTTAVAILTTPLAAPHISITMNLDLFAYPMVANTDYSPTNESFSWQDSFDLACPVDLYTTPPDYSLDTFPDDSFDCPVSSVSFPADLNYRSAFHPAPPFGQPEQSFAPSFDTASTFDPRMPTTPTTTLSSAPSLCGDGTPALASPPSSLKREIPDEPSPGEEPAIKRPRRKRGRPRLDRRLSDAASISYIDSPSSKHHQPTSRLPHNGV